MPPPSLTPTLSSKWDGLSPYLIAEFYQVDRDGKRVDPNVSVQAPLTNDASLDVTLSWQSAFENSGPETKAPTLAAAIQSGAFQQLANDAAGLAAKAAAAFGVDTDSWQQKSAEFQQQLEGRTGITKLNSIQVFTGMPPVKLQVTALFRAWRDPVSEVEAPIDQLMQWALPQELAADSTILTRAAGKIAGSGMSATDVALPSKAPTLIALRYKNRLYSPLVIESIGLPIGSPVTASGRYVEMAIPLTLATLTALDRNDWTAMRI